MKGKEQGEYVSRLAWERLGVMHEMEELTGDRKVVWVSLPLQPEFEEESF